MKNLPTYLHLRLVAGLSLTFATIAPSNVSAQIVISVGPPQIPVYAQPPSPGEAFVWAPGHWGRNPSGYAWIEGSWLMPPSPGMLWTPGYWRPQPGGFAWQAGRWGTTVGYYGGVNYGFGYMGSGFSPSTLRHEEIRHEVLRYREDGGGRPNVGGPPSRIVGDNAGNWSANGQGSQAGHIGNGYGGGRPTSANQNGNGSTGTGTGTGTGNNQNSNKSGGPSGSGLPVGTGSPVGSKPPSGPGSRGPGGVPGGGKGPSSAKAGPGSS